ncbi:Hypothetical protein PENO1_103130 [Penicillium occitanis (nom. inval.)]|nr:Hypothetical protein PENO1_103130 [Penicillium occitanis (nom. inval.)]PCG89716.1 hypothetical protein PENOC_105310 [Penicillium occitanis (nom. inval.)]
MEVARDINILAQLDEFLEQDKERDILLRNLVKTIEEKKDQVQQLKYELDHERESRLRYQQQVRELQEEKKRLDDIIKKDPFVTVLIDGDGAIFRNEFLGNPAQGAQKAALALQQQIKSYLKKTQLDTESIPILVRIFVNLHGLAGKMRSLAIIESEKDLRIFAESFNKSRAEFDMVDVGSGKENADAKMRKMLTQSIKNFQCQKVIFAGCHDAGYMHDLNEYQGNQATKDRIVLLETTPAHPSFRAMGYELVQFDQVFRSDPLEMRLKETTSSPSSEAIRQEGISLANNGVSSSNSPQRESPVEVQNVASSGNGGYSINYSTTSAVTYATVGRANGQQNIYLFAKNAKAARPTVDRNAKGQRVDSALQSFRNNQVIGTYTRKLEAIKPQGFCNEFYLVGKCERDSLPLYPGTPDPLWKRALVR